MLGWSVAVAAALLVGCGRAPSTPTAKVTWVVGQAMPAFDPGGPPNPVRRAIERLLSRGLVDEDSTGRVVLAAAESVTVSQDRLLYHFHLRAKLAFSDGSLCASDAFRQAIESCLNRFDHAMDAWRFVVVEGMSKVRAGRLLPALGIQTSDFCMLIL